MTAPPPIRIPCEGSATGGHPLENGLLICSMCGRLVRPVIATDDSPYIVQAPPHDRDDIISMLQRGDFDAT